MKPFPRILLGLPLALLLSAGACHPVATRGTAALLDDVESYINDRPDSALAVLRALDSTAVRGRALRARTALLHSTALDKCYIDLQTDSILAPAVTWYERHGSPDDKLKTLYYLGRIQYNAGNYQEAIVTYTEALEVTDKAKDLKYIGFVNQAIADTYSATLLDGESIIYLDRAHDSFIRISDDSLAKKTLYKKAIAFSNLQEWEKADSLFNLLLNYPEGIESLLPAIHASYALSLILHDDKNAEQAVAQFQEALKISPSVLSANKWAAYAYGLSLIGDTKLSDSVFDQLYARDPSDRKVAFWRNETEHSRGNFEEAYKLLESSLTYQDSLLRRQLTQSTLAAQKDFFSNKKQVAENEFRTHRLRVYILIILLLLIVSNLIFTFWIKIRKYQVQSQSYLHLMEAMELKAKEAKLQKRQIFHAYLYVYGQLAEEYERTKDEGHLDRKSFRRLKQVIANLKGNGKGLFEESINSTMDNLMARFRDDFDKILKEEDSILVSYLFAGFDTITSSTLLGITPEAFYMRKSRIKKVVKESTANNKEEYLSFFTKVR